MEFAFTLLPSGFNLSKDIDVESTLSLRCRDTVLDDVKPATSVTCTFRVIPSEGTKVEYLKLPLLDKDTGFPSTVTSATWILSRAIPVIVPRLPFVLLDMI